MTKGLPKISKELARTMEEDTKAAVKKDILDFINSKGTVSEAEVLAFGEEAYNKRLIDTMIKFKLIKELPGGFITLA